MKRDRALTTRIERLIASSDAMHRTIGDRAGSSWDPNITSDPRQVLDALGSLPVREGLFLEWGSGLGTITLIAGLLGYDAHGIEANPALVHAALGLSVSEQIDVQFAHGNFVPEGYRDNPEVMDLDFVHDASAPDGYDALCVPLSEFDVVFAFPWPGEEELFLDIFDRHARRGARLLLNLGRDGTQCVR